MDRRVPREWLEAAICYRAMRRCVRRSWRRTSLFTAISRAIDGVIRAREIASAHPGRFLDRSFAQEKEYRPSLLR